MQQALRKWNEEEDKSVEKAEILEYLAFSLYAQGNMRRALREGIVRKNVEFMQHFRWIGSLLALLRTYNLEFNFLSSPD